MFSSIRHIPHVHRLSSFCVTGYQHGRQETKTVTELKNISCRRSLSFCPPASTDYWNSCYFQAYELWNNGYRRFHSKTFKWHWRFKILLVSTGALSLDPPPYPPNSISSQHKHHKWQPWRTGYKPVGACTLSDGAKCQRCFRFWSIEFSSPVVVSHHISFPSLLWVTSSPGMFLWDDLLVFNKCIFVFPRAYDPGRGTQGNIR